jgi:hypothetical protein
VDCTGAVATVISTVIGTIKSVALPTDCTLKITGNDTIPAGVFFAIPCGARVQVDGAAVLTFNAETDDNTCQKFTASGAGAGAGGGIVKGLRFNRPEWWGAARRLQLRGTLHPRRFRPAAAGFQFGAGFQRVVWGPRASQIRLRQGLRRQHRRGGDRHTERATADQRLRAARRRQQRGRIGALRTHRLRRHCSDRHRQYHHEHRNPRL